MSKEPSQNRAPTLQQAAERGEALGAAFAALGSNTPLTSASIEQVHEAIERGIAEAGAHDQLAYDLAHDDHYLAEQGFTAFGGSQHAE